MDDKFDLTGDERQVASCYQRGERYLGHGRPVSVRATLIRRLLYGPPLPGAPDGDPPTGLYLEGVTVEGVLDLSDGPAGRSELGPLVLEDSIFAGGVVLTASRLRRLSLRASRFPFLDARWCRISGPVDLRDVSAILTADRPGLDTLAPCTVDLVGAQISGGIDLARARLRIPDLKPPQFSADQVQYALDLGEASVSGDLTLEPGFAAHGGVRMRDAMVANVWAQGAELTAAPKGRSLNAQRARIAGALALGRAGEAEPPPTFRAHGLIFLYATKAFTVQIISAICEGVDLSDADITGPLLISDALVGETLDLTDARIGGRATLSNAEVGALEAARVQVGSDLDLRGSQVTKNIVLRDGQIRGDLIIGGVISRPSVVDAHEEPLGPDIPAPAHAATIDAMNLGIDGWVWILNARVNGLCQLLNAKIGKSFFCSESTIGTDLTISHATVAGNAQFDKLTISGRLNMEGAKIGGNLRVSGLVFVHDLFGGPRENSWRDARVTGNFKVDGVTLTPDAPADAAVDGIHAFRRRKLACYPGWWLVEAETRLKSGVDNGAIAPHPAVIAFLWSERRSVLEHGTALVLNGESNSIHELNDVQRPRIRSRQAAADYLGLFTSYLNGGDGRFYIDDSDWARDFAETGRDRWGNPLGYELATTVQYGGQLFVASFTVARTGDVNMVDDRGIAARSGSERWEKFMRIGTDASERLPPGMAAPTPWRVMEPAVAKRSPFASPRRYRGAWLRQRWLPRRLLLWVKYRWAEVRPEDSLGQRMLTALRGACAPVPIIDLSNAVAGQLDDQEGAGWGHNVRLVLNGLTYRIAPRRVEPLTPFKSPSRKAGGLERIAFVPWRQRVGPLVRNQWRRFLGHPPIGALPWNATPFERRRRWLDLQFRYGRRNRTEYRPQPYDALVAAFRADGNHDAARKVLSLKLTVERKFKGRAARWLVYWPYWAAFDYGLSPRRALVALVAFLFAGWLGTAFMNRHGLLVPAATVVASAPQPGAPSAKPPQPILSCAPDVLSQALYALDVMVPIDFHQEARCRIAEVPVPTWWLRAQLWESLKTIYTALGTIVVSLATLTISGFLRRQAEP